MRLQITTCLAWCALSASAFLPSIRESKRLENLRSTPNNIDVAFNNKQEEILKKKQALYNLLNVAEKNDNAVFQDYVDRVLACPKTKEPLSIRTLTPKLEGGSAGVKISLISKESENYPSYTYTGRTDSYFDLLNVVTDDKSSAPDGSDDAESNSSVQNILNSLRVFIPPPLRIAGDDAYVPMRDLFTSPFVSYAYERGWRQGFQAAGFPGIDKEFELVKDYFSPCTPDKESSVVIDMSCATGLMTRRLLNSGKYGRVIGCDYSDAMLNEASTRIRPIELNSEKTRLNLVRCDVAKMPMQAGSVNALHAGAAMHCWPELEDSLAEIYRVLKPGGRYFATTFLSEYFKSVNAVASGINQNVSQQAFQSFTVEYLRELVLGAGFEEDKVKIEVVGLACVIIRCEK